MPISIAYNNNPSVPCTLRPTPLVSINMSVNKTGAGENVGVTYAITLTGTILADRGSPFGIYSVTKLPFKVDADDGIYVPTGYGPYGAFYTGSNYGTVGPAPQIVPIDHSLDSIFSKQKAIRALFARDGQLMEISPVHGDAAVMYCNPRVISISFAEGIYVNKCDYTIELEADTLRDKAGLVDNEGLSLYIKEGGLFATAVEGSTVFDQITEPIYVGLGQYFIKDFSEDWSMETDEQGAQTADSGYLLPRSYSISHSISAQGKTHYLPDGTKLRAWQQAKGFVQTKLMTLESGIIYQYPNSLNYSLADNGRATSDINTTPSVIAGFIGQGALDLVKEFGGYNRVMSESIDEAAGTYSLTETWVLATGTAFENYSLTVSKSNDNQHTAVSIDGTITGLTSMNPANWGGVNTVVGHVTRSGVDRTGEEQDDRAFHLGIGPQGFINSANMNAKNKWDEVSASGTFGYNSLLYKRANFAVSDDSGVLRRLNPQELSYNIAIDEAAGAVNYTAEFNTRPINILSNVLYENITINDTYPGDVFATIPVIGRKTGPILQYIGGRTEYMRDLTIEVLVDRGNQWWGDTSYETVSTTHGHNFLDSGNMPKPSGSLLPQKPSIVEPNRTQLQQLIMELSPMNEPGIRKYFIAPPTESWEPKEGRYNLNLQWTYELEN